MTLPGTEVISRDTQPSASSEIDTSTAFFVGMAERGPANKAVLVRSDAEAAVVLGDKVAYGTLRDSLEVFFREGGSRAYIGRVVGPSPTYSSVSVTRSGGGGNTVTVTAKNPGVSYDDLDFVVEAGSAGGLFKVKVNDSGTTVESSGDLATVAELLAWAATSDYIRITDLGSGLDPEVGTYALVGGQDDYANATDTQWQNALDLLTADLGTGQVAAPGRTTTTIHNALLTHAEERVRWALLDYPDTHTTGTLEALRSALTASGRYGMHAGAPWPVVPGVAVGTFRTVPPSAMTAGLIARSESIGNDPSVPAAGDNGRSQFALRLSQDPWTDAEREDLNEAGVNVYLIRDGVVTLYGYRSLANPNTQPGLVQASVGRVLMALSAEAQEVAERFVFDRIDGKGKTMSAFAGALAAVCLDYYDDGALYGATPAEAFAVQTDASVNPVEDLAEGILRAVIAVKVSPFAERVIIEITKVANTEVIA